MTDHVDPQTVHDSLFLHQLCCDVGFSRKRWLQRIRTSDIQNTYSSFLGWYSVKKRYKSLYSGSSAEGVAASFLGSDIDIMFVLDGTSVTEPGQVSRNNSDHIFQIVHVQHPAFVRLMMLSMSSTQNTRIEITPNYCEVDEEGRLVLNGRRIVEERFSGIRHGPAASSQIQSGIMEIDNVASLHCREWPSASEEWIQRYRPYNWPSPELIKEIMENGCELVAVGRPNSPRPHLEWRLSSSLAELILIRSLNIIQIQCYFLLKMTLVFLIKPVEPNSLASYHMKIVILHMVENTDPSTWTMDRLNLCFMKCLKLLLIYLELGYCPQIFIPQHNLFERKVAGSVRRKLVDIVRGLTREGWKCLLRCLPFNSEQFACHHGGMRCPCHIGFWQEELVKCQGMDITICVRGFTDLILQLLHKNVPASFTDTVDELKSFIQDRVPEDHDFFPSVECSEYVRKTISCHLGYMHLSVTRGRNVRDVRRLAPILRYAKNLLVCNCDVDVTSCRLKLATFYYQMEQRERCVQTVTDVLHRYTAEVLPCIHDLERVKSFLQSYRDRLVTLIPYCGDLHALMKKCAYPVCFSVWEVPCAPTAIQELAHVKPLITERDRQYHSLILIDPLVYAYYLLVIVHHDLKQEQQCRLALVRMRHIVLNPNMYFLFYPECASYLLEYCERYASIESR